jgi:GNAT superfamily N-acetyltransferase
MEAHVLDNPLWHMLCHDLADVSYGTALAKRSDPAVFAGTAIADHSDAAFADLAGICSPGETIYLVESSLPPAIPGFESGSPFYMDQLVCQQRTPITTDDIDIIELAPTDAADAGRLIDLAQPGPFFPGLLSRRNFIGVRHRGELIAMAGERIRLPGYGEISGVCTHPDWRGRGYAQLLSHIVALRTWQRGDTPFLHVLPHNGTAYRIYERLNFVRRCVMSGCGYTRQ